MTTTLKPIDLGYMSSSNVYRVANRLSNRYIQLCRNGLILSNAEFYNLFQSKAWMWMILEVSARFKLGSVITERLYIDVRQYLFFFFFFFKEKRRGEQRFPRNGQLN